MTGVPRAELREFVESLGEPPYRATQIFKAVHQRRLRSFDDITDLPKKFREKLAERADISRLTVEQKYVSTDGTRRYLMKTADGRPVETVFIPTEGRDTICFSSQSGCPLKCDFCLTAQLGLLRNLTAGEIVEQIIIVLNDVYGEAAETPHGTNLVGMGAGEPFLNFENLITALRITADEDGLFIVPNRVTISTAGIVPKIYEFATLPDRPHLAISLTAATDELRDRLMPINKRWDLDELMTAAKEFEGSLRRGERFTFEYVMLGGVNDSPEDARKLARLLDRFQLSRVKINLIPHNGAEQLDYDASSPEAVARFKSTLESMGIDAYVRTPRGRDIYAACGQLAAMEKAA
ncbi:MAG: 23S rRNA (adenine(2503)-C(2))-methyltransferase RlmN [Acidobacteriota bacterium]|nr:MAG: 23S rRNA (adenine(2503)-C(2))-methyltransferase RlmN [Acidobacteriota bacterium]